MPFPKETCPYRGNEHCRAEWCDVGFTQMSPYHCDACPATEIGAYDKTVPTAAETAAGWYAPGRLPDTVSSVNGCRVDTKTALRLDDAGVVPSLHVGSTSTTPNWSGCWALGLQEYLVQ